MKSLVIGLISFLSLSTSGQSIPTITLGQAATCNIGWDQVATTLVEAQGFVFKAVADSQALAVVPTTCSGTASPFVCQTPLPIKTVGTHTVTIQNELSDGTPGGVSATFTYKITGNPPIAPANLRLILSGVGGS